MPFQFRRLRTEVILLVSQAGEYLFITDEELESLIGFTIDRNSKLGQDLHAKQFLALNSNLDTPIDLLATKLRTRKAFLRQFTSLHMVVMTCYCNCRCNYCQASSIAPTVGENGSMSIKTAKKVVDMIFLTPSSDIKIEFQGGEPTLNWSVVEFIVRYAEKINKTRKKRLGFVLCTNLVSIQDKVLAFIKEHRINISTSLDGPRELHDAHRIARTIPSSYDAFRTNLDTVRSYLGCNTCSPLLTITRNNLHRLRDVVDEYHQLGFQGIFLRSLNPYGMAKADWDSLSYPLDEFIEAYKDVISYIIEMNLHGKRFTEYFTTLLLSRILTPFSTGFVDLQSPAGAGISGVIYDYDGKVYPADEGRMLARMGDKSFYLGNVHIDSYDDIFLGDRLKHLIANTCVECLPGCAHCAYQQYCGADPIRYYVECGDIVGHRPTSAFCKKHMAIFDFLFTILKENQPEVMDIFWSWITHRPLAEIRI